MQSELHYVRLTGRVQLSLMRINVDQGSALLPRTPIALSSQPEREGQTSKDTLNGVLHARSASRCVLCTVRRSLSRRPAVEGGRIGTHVVDRAGGLEGLQSKYIEYEYNIIIVRARAQSIGVDAAQTNYSA